MEKYTTYRNFFAAVPCPKVIASPFINPAYRQVYPLRA